MEQLITSILSDDFKLTILLFGVCYFFFNIVNFSRNYILYKNEKYLLTKLNPKECLEFLRDKNVFKIENEKIKMLNRKNKVAKNDKKI